MGTFPCSLPFSCAVVTLSETTRHRQGWQGYDTSHDTILPGHPIGNRRAPAAPARDSRDADVDPRGGGRGGKLATITSSGAKRPTLGMFPGDSSSPPPASGLRAEFAHGPGALEA